MRHANRCNVLFGDGHVTGILPGEFIEQVAKPYGAGNATFPAQFKDRNGILHTVYK
jgi:prepilin-type processing-associated H-X9-DG protein